MSVTSVTQSLTGTGKANGATGKLADDYQTFLTLLVAQVQNQDPLAPMESTEFVSQLAQLTQVEQSVQVNAQMESLRQQLAMNAALSETALIGREVTMPSDSFTLSENGADFSYRLAGDALQVQAQIRDSAGNLVHVISQLPTAGEKMHHVQWDGRLASGELAPVGRYSLSMAAAGADGADGAYSSYAAGVVEAVEYDGGKTWLQLADGQRVQSGEIIRAR